MREKRKFCKMMCAKQNIIKTYEKYKISLVYVLLLILYQVLKLLILKAELSIQQVFYVLAKWHVDWLFWWGKYFMII